MLIYKYSLQPWEETCLFHFFHALLDVNFNKVQKFMCNFPILQVYAALALEITAFYELSTNIGVRIRTLFSLFSVAAHNGLVCVFEFGEPKASVHKHCPTGGGGASASEPPCWSAA